MTTRAIEVTDEIERATEQVRAARAGVVAAQRGSAVWGQAVRWQSETKCALADLVTAATVRPVWQGKPVDVEAMVADAKAAERERTLREVLGVLDFGATFAEASEDGAARLRGEGMRGAHRAIGVLVTPATKHGRAA